MEEKKKKVEKKEVKKKEVKKPVKKETRSALPNEEPFGLRFRRFVSSYKFLYTAFAVLFIIVALLAIMVFVRSREDVGNKSNIVFSILEENTHNYLDMDLESLVGKEYTLKVTNYRGNKINKNGAKYTITVTNETEGEIEILKENQGKNLMTDAKRTVIEGETLGTEEKEEVVYYFRVTKSDKIKAGDKIRIEVAS
ncbi:MAG: hypothetical protein J6X28_04135 [Bacilli bacterium]|nr:hypothetical protein [Bacilli bacterium]